MATHGRCSCPERREERWTVQVHTSACLRQTAAWYREAAESARRINMHYRKFYLQEVKRHEAAAVAAEAEGR